MRKLKIINKFNQIGINRFTRKSLKDLFKCRMYYKLRNKINIDRLYVPEIYLYYLTNTFLAFFCGVLAKQRRKFHWLFALTFIARLATHTHTTLRDTGTTLYHFYFNLACVCVCVGVRQDLASLSFPKWQFSQ